ncbi:MAG: dockerin type I domain-containing protein [Firmicutes bacterium]|nr:dockerin type I domain-containing protein [Bacillota bacterium]
MKSIKKTLALLIAAAMITTSAAMPALAEDVDTAAEEAVVEVLDVEEEEAVEEEAAEEDAAEEVEVFADSEEEAEIVEVFDDEEEEEEEAEETYVAKLGYDTAAVGYTSFGDLADAVEGLSYDESAAKLSLTADVELSGQLEIVSGEVTLDLAGYTLSRNTGTENSTDTYRYKGDMSLLKVDEDATLNIIDSGTDGTLESGKFWYYSIKTNGEYNYLSSTKSGNAIFLEGTLNLTDVTIDAGYGIFMNGNKDEQTGATLNMTGGSIVNATGYAIVSGKTADSLTATAGYGNITISGVTITDAGAAAIYAANNVSLSISGSTMSSGGVASTVYVSGGTLEISDSEITCDKTSAALTASCTSATISDSTLTANTSSSAVVVSSDECTITDCDMTSIGTSATVKVSSGTTTISGGTVTNTATSTSTQTAGIQVSGAATVTVTDDTTVTCNNKYGIYVSGAGSVTVEDATVTGGTVGVCVNNASGSVTVEDGEISGGVTASKGTVTIEGGTVSGTLTETSGTITITGGTFDTNVSEYTADNYYVSSETEETTTYTVNKSTSTFDKTDTQANYSVELVRLEDNKNVNNTTASYTYTVVTETVDVEDYSSVVTIADETDTFAVDISVEVTDNLTGETVTGVEITNQTVTITLPVAMQVTKITHVKDDSTTEDITTGITQDTSYSTVTFTASSFSAYIVQGSVVNTNVTENVKLSLEATGTAGVYNVVLTAVDNDSYINGFTSAQLKFYATADTTESSECAIVVSQLYDYIDVTDEGDGVYLINANDESNGGVTGETVTIAQLTLVGVGTYSVYLDVTNYSDNMVHTTTATNNLVVTHTPDATTPSAGTLQYTVPLLSGVVVDLEKSTLTINVMFPNAVTAQDAEYNAMTVTVTGIGVDEEIEIGQDEQGSLQTVTISGVDASNDYATATGYVATIDDVYTGYAYTLEFTGEGYRTFRTSVVPTSDAATITVWNNAMSNEMIVVTDTDDAMGGDDETVTFLAGDIVANNVIDLWDLSAVVSYFGKGDMTSYSDISEVEDYIKYDLNRDGKIDSRDIAMVLVSWDY